MLIKVVLVFLLVMVLIGMVGKVLFPGRMPRLGMARCKSCGRPVLGRGPCPCKGGRG